MVKYELLADGGFVVADFAARVSAYAYPTSLNACAAKRHPAKMALLMLRDERKLEAAGIIPAYIRESSFIAMSRHFTAAASVLVEG